MTPADRVLLAVGALFIVGIVASRLADRLQVPDVALYLVGGVLIGPHFLGLFNEPAGSVAAQIVVTFGASLILYEGGCRLDVSLLRRLWLTVTLLATIGVLTSTLVVGIAASWVAGVALPVTLLAAAVLAPTDPSIVMPVMQQSRVRPRLSQTAQAESALNDATGAIVALSVLRLVQGASLSWSGIGLDLVASSVGGLIVGGVIGLAAAALVSGGRRGLRVFGRHEHGTIMSLITVLSAFLLATALGASGFMAVFGAGLVHGNKQAFHLEVPGEHELRRQEYLSLTALLMRMMIFVLLGSEFDPTTLGAALTPAVVIVAALVLVGRPVSVLFSMLPDRRAAWRWNELVFMFWVRETGVIPAALAGLLLAQRVPGAALVAAAVFLAILVTVLVQAGTTRWVGRRLGVLDVVDQGPAAKPLLATRRPN